MRDDNGNEAPEQVGPSPEHGEGEYPIDRLRQRLGHSFAGRPVMVYLVLLAGAATLLLLLVIVWYSATGGGKDESPICTAISADDATKLILAGQVGRVDVLVDRDDPLGTLTLIVLRQNDGSCRQTAQGADVRNDLYRILGVIAIYNTFGEQHVRVEYQRQDVQPELLATSTPSPSPTLPPTVTNTPLPTDSPTLPPTEAPTVAPTLAPATSTVSISPSTAEGSPTPSPTQTPAISSTVLLG